jgi:hypothetical protein
VAGVVAIGGTATERDRGVVSAATETAVRSNGWRLPAKQLPKPDADALVNCAVPAEPWRCVPASIDTQGIRHALVVTVESKQSASGVPMLVLTGKVIVTSPTALIVHQRFCEHCADDKLAQASTELTAQLLNELAVRTGRTVLGVSSVPAGAVVSVDGQPTGATNGTFNTYPGLRTVTIEKQGFWPETVKVEAEEGKTATVAVTLRDRQPAPRPSRLVPASLAGAGVALVAAGTFIALDQQDGVDDKYSHPRATPVGASVGVAGLAAIGVGAYLWLRGSPAAAAPVAAPAASATVPAFTVTPGGALVGWLGTF